MAIAIYQDLQGRQYWADSTSESTRENLADGSWVLYDDTPGTPPPPPVDPFDDEVAERIDNLTSKTRVRLRAASGSSAGPLVDRPAASTTAVRWYFATDDDGGTLYRNTGTSWVQVALGLSEIAQAPMWVPARAFRASVGTPAEGLVASSSQNVFLFDPTTAETAVAMLALPSSWTSINIDLYWTRTGTALDPVVWRVDRKNLAVGAALAGSTVGPNVTSTPDVATATVLFAVRTNTALSVTPPLARLHISRVADDAADTLAVDAAVLGLMISKA